MGTVKVMGLTGNNVDALKEVFPEAIEAGDLEVGRTVATFRMGDPLKFLGDGIASLRDRGHPRASLHAVVRKVRTALEKGEQSG
jgi:hypothetical protein